MDLTNVKTHALLKELLARKDLINEQGMTVYPEGYSLITKMTPLPCTDGVPVRMRQDGTVEGALIVRGSGFYKGKYTMIGGRVAYGRTLASALEAHFKTDLGVQLQMLSDWTHPDFVFQYFPQKQEGCGHDPSKHAIALTYLVTLRNSDMQYGTTSHGGQEALGLQWFSFRNRPPSDEFGYNHDVSWTTCLLKAMRSPDIRRLLPLVD